jgi:hypothetical protein
LSQAIHTQGEHHGEFAQPSPGDVPGQMVGGLGYGHDHNLVVEQLQWADNAFARLLTVRARALPQLSAQRGPALMLHGHHRQCRDCQEGETGHRDYLR